MKKKFLPHRENRAMTDRRPLGTGPDRADVSHTRDTELRDTFTRRLVGEPLTGHKDWGQGLTFSPDGTLITTGGNDGVRLW
ncbi:hypothetical protein, partial [Streptomyces sp. NPDC001312]|uniref:hypothetical protein n=1 Tax=Streptomyces sp. NPDC001312 TaxID=3364561 RepID=UPI0036C03036